MELIHTPNIHQSSLSPLRHSDFGHLRRPKWSSAPICLQVENPDPSARLQDQKPAEMCSFCQHKLESPGYAGFLHWGYPRMDGLQWKIHLNMDNLRVHSIYQHFRKPPYGVISWQLIIISGNVAHWCSLDVGIAWNSPKRPYLIGPRMINYWLLDTLW